MEEYYELKRFLLNEDLAKKWHELLEWTNLTDDQLFEHIVNKLHKAAKNRREQEII